MKTSARFLAILLSATALFAANVFAEHQQEDFKKAEAELDKVYQQAIAKLETMHRERLKIDQRAWLTFRAEHCECVGFLSTYSPDVPNPFEYFGCLDELTRERTRWLHSWFIGVGK